jgi:hypothetical protein
VHWLTEDVVIEFLPPGDEERVSYYCWCENPGVKSWGGFILKNSSGLYDVLNFLSGFEEFMKE